MKQVALIKSRFGSMARLPSNRIDLPFYRGKHERSAPETATMIWHLPILNLYARRHGTGQQWTPEDSGNMLDYNNRMPVKIFRSDLVS